MKVESMTTASILRSIETLQSVQQTNPPTSKPWQEASKLLNELFKEMSRRERNGDPEATLQTL